LPDGIFSNPKSQVGSILEGLAIEDAGVFYGLLVNFPAIWYILGHFCKFMVIWFIFPRFGILYHEKSGNPGCNVIQIGT
jgi:hypothetical protein